MYKFEKKNHNYIEALKLKYEARESIAKQTDIKRTDINVAFDSIDDVVKFNEYVFKDKDQEKVYIVEPNFINPRRLSDLNADYSANCLIM